MIGNSLLTQIGIAGLAIGIIITYIKPTFVEIKTIQDKTVQTRDELQKVTDVNQSLATLLASVNAIPQRDKLALNTYLPDTVDEVKVLKDLSIITEEAEVLVKDLKYVGTSEASLAPKDEAVVEEYVYDETQAGEGETGPVVHLFSLSIVTLYEDLKDFLTLIEKNNYPLEIHKFSLKSDEDGELNIDLEIATYSLKE